MKYSINEGIKDIFKKSKPFTPEELKSMGINTASIKRTEIPRTDINRSNVNKINTTAHEADDKNNSKNESCGIFSNINLI